MNLYKITRSDEPNYDEFVGLVVAAKDEESAKQSAYMARHNHKYADITPSYAKNFDSSNIQVEHIGTTSKFEDGHIVLADFLHG